ncbi:hypothetical protein Tco_1118363 [Tanacetum coccineum]
MDIDDEEDENGPELTFPYEEVDPLNPQPPASDSEPKDVIKVEDIVKPEDETVPASVYQVDCFSFKMSVWSLAAHALVKKNGKEKYKYYGKLIADLGNEVRSSVEEGAAAMENLKERVERDLYWTRVQAYEFYQEMIRRGVMFEERPNEAIDVPIEDEESQSSELRGSPRDY